MSLPNSPWAGINDVITELFLPRGSLVSDILAGDGKLVNLFLRCVVKEASRNFLFTFLFHNPAFKKRLKTICVCFFGVCAKKCADLILYAFQKNVELVIW
jgi:hypothetical protein